MRIFKSKGVVRFSRREHITDTSLLIAIQRAEQGIVDADLGGGLIKLRIPRPGHGRSGGFRMIVAYRQADRAMFLYGFAKNDRGNISHDEQHTLRTIGANWLAATDEAIKRALIEGALLEITDEDITT